MLFPKGKGEIIDEETLYKRIHEAVRQSLENDVNGTIQLHNFLCGGQVHVHQDEAGDPLDKDGKVIDSPFNEAWTYVFTKGDDE